MGVVIRVFSSCCARCGSTRRSTRSKSATYRQRLHKRALVSPGALCACFVCGGPVGCGNTGIVSRHWPRDTPPYKFLGGLYTGFRVDHEWGGTGAGVDEAAAGACRSVGRRGEASRGGTCIEKRDGHERASQARKHRPEGVMSGEALRQTTSDVQRVPVLMRQQQLVAALDAGERRLAVVCEGQRLETGHRCLRSV